jgi:hypothetical protein
MQRRQQSSSLRAVFGIGHRGIVVWTPRCAVWCAGLRRMGTREVGFSGSLLVGQCVFVCQNRLFGQT